MSILKKYTAILILIMVGLLVIATYPSKVVGESTASLFYTIQEEGSTEPIDFKIHISSTGVRYDFKQGKIYRSMLYRHEKNPVLYTLNHSELSGHKITEQGIEHYISLMQDKVKRVRQKLRQMPEDQRSKIKERLNLTSIDPDKSLPRPQFNPSEAIIWNGLRAQKGTFSLAGGAAGRAIMSKDPLVDLRKNENNSLSAFTDFLYQWRSIATQTNQRSINSPRNLIAGHYLNLIEYNYSGQKMTLNNWSRNERSSNFFSVPPSYEIKSLENLGNNS